jgi:hypothetical protein
VVEGGIAEPHWGQTDGFNAPGRLEESRLAHASQRVAVASFIDAEPS